MKPLPYGRQTIEDDDIAAVSEALRGDFLTTGPRVEQFERAFAEATGAAHAAACNSGTAALHLAVLALDIGPRDAVIVPTLTFLATANVVRMTGAEVVFADVDPDTGLLAPETLADAHRRALATGRRPRLGIPVHLNGQVCDMPALADFARAHDLELIEDACHALGAAHAGACRYSRAACFSTHPVKAIATGEGGVVTTADATLAARMRRLRNHGMQRDADAFVNRMLAFDGAKANPWYYEMQEVGWNYRMPDILCALGLSQLRKLDRFHRRRVELAALYDALLEPLAPAVRPVRRPSESDGWHLYAVLIAFDRIGVTRAALIAELQRAGIGAQVHYIPVHLQPYYQERYGALRLPGAETYYSRCLSLPFYPALSEQDVAAVVDTLAKLVAKPNSRS